MGISRRGLTLRNFTVKVNEWMPTASGRKLIAAMRRSVGSGRVARSMNTAMGFSIATGGQVRSHRAAYELTHGPIPDEDLEGQKICVLHRCDNPPCCNPAHLFLGTRSDNHADMVAKGRIARHGKPRGESHSQTPLTEQDVRRIRRRYRNGDSLRRIADDFPVSHVTIANIVHRRTWAHLEEDE